MKLKFDPWAALFPCPVVLVTCIDSEEKPNIITLAWVGIACSDPPTLTLGIRPARHSYKLIENSKEFVVNIPTTDILKETDICGLTSGKNIDKFLETGLTSRPAEKVKPPIINQCPINMECIVKSKIPLGSHHLFIGEVISIHIDENISTEKGDIDFSKITPFVYNQGEYWNLKSKIGRYGFSKKSTPQ